MFSFWIKKKTDGTGLKPPAINNDMNFHGRFMVGKLFSESNTKAKIK